MARSLNKVQLIGNLTRDPELRYTPNGNAVCTFSLATNRYWTVDSGEKREEVDFHRIVAWNKLAELCSQFLVKGRKVYVEGRLSTRNWTGQDGTQKTTTEVVIDDMILLDNKGAGAAGTGTPVAARPAPVKALSEETEEPEMSALNAASVEETVSGAKGAKTAKKKENEIKEEVAAESDEVPESKNKHEEVMPDDIPF